MATEEHVDEGTYFALSYRGKRVCIDTGILYVLEQFIGEFTGAVTRARIDHMLYEFLKDYQTVWCRNAQGEIVEITKLTSNFVKIHESKHVYNGLRSFGHMELVLSPHYKVPNEVRSTQRLEGDQPAG